MHFYVVVILTALVIVSEAYPHISFRNEIKTPQLRMRRQSGGFIWEEPAANDTTGPTQSSSQIPTTQKTISSTQTTTTTPTAKTTVPAAVQACEKTCVTTSQYDPVCGTNEITYDNPQRLKCAQKCGLDVEMAYHYRC